MSSELFSKVLIGGSPSSGSTLLSIMLDSHPDVYCGPETNIAAHPGIWREGANIGFFLNLPGTAVSCREGATWARPSSAGLAYHLGGLAELRVAVTSLSNASQMLDWLFKPRTMLEGKSVACEKSPPNIYAVIPALRSDPHLKAIVSVRNGSDVVSSLHRRKVVAPVAVLRWLSKMNLALAARESFADRVLIVRYEDLISDPLLAAESICAFLGITAGQHAKIMVDHSASKRIGVDHTISGETGAATTWCFKPTQPISQRNTGQDKVPAHTAAWLNRLRLNKQVMTLFGMDFDPLDATSVSLAFGYKPNWDQTTSERVQWVPSANRLAQFCAELADPSCLNSGT